MATSNFVTAPAELQDEITRGLEALKKTGYRATVHEDQPSGELVISFSFGASEQRLKFARDEWRKPGTVQQRIIDNLDI